MSQRRTLEVASSEQVISLLTDLNKTVSELSGKFSQFEKSQDDAHDDIKEDLETLKQGVDDIRRISTSNKNEIDNACRDIISLKETGLTDKKNKQINYTSLGTILLGAIEIIKTILGIL